MNDDPPAIAGEALVPQTFLERHGISPVLFAFISLLVIFVLYQMVGGIITFLLFGAASLTQNAAAIRVATFVGQIVFILVPTIGMTGLATTERAAFLRLRPPRWDLLVVPFFGIFSLQQMLQVYMSFQERVPVPESLRPIVEQLKHLFEETYKILLASSSVPELLFVVFVVALVPAVAEEFLFRGMVQRSLERGLGARRGIILTALIFALYHLNPFSLVPLMSLGLYLGFLAYRAGSLWVSVAAHFYNNGVACIAVYFGMEEDFLVSGKPETLAPDTMLLTFLAFSVVFFLSTYYVVRSTAPSNVPTEAG